MCLLLVTGVQRLWCVGMQAAFVRQCGGSVHVESFLLDPEVLEKPPVGDPVRFSITRGWVVAAQRRLSPARTVGRSERWEFSGAGFRLLDELGFAIG